MCEHIQTISYSSDSRILESFFEKCGCRRILLKANNGNYLTEEKSFKNFVKKLNSTQGYRDLWTHGIPIEASKDKVNGFCIFYIKKIDENTVALKTATNSYLSRYTFFINKLITIRRE